MKKSNLIILSAFILTACNSGKTSGATSQKTNNLNNTKSTKSIPTGYKPVIMPFERHNVVLSNYYSSRYADVENAKFDYDTPVQQYIPNGTIAQKWDIIPLNEVDKDGIPLFKIVTNGDWSMDPFRNSQQEIRLSKYDSRQPHLKWRVFKMENITSTNDGYRFQNLSNDNFLDLSQCSINNGVRLKLNPETNNCGSPAYSSQAWRIGTRTTRNGINLQSLATKEIATINGNELELKDFIDSLSQRLNFISTDSGDVIITTKIADKEYMLRGGDIPKLVEYKDNDEVWDLWALEEYQNGVYKIRNRYFNGYLSINHCSGNNNTLVMTYPGVSTCNNNDYSKWLIKDIDFRNVAIRNSYQGRLLDLKNNNISDYEKVLINYNSGAKSQQWDIKKIKNQFINDEQLYKISPIGTQLQLSWINSLVGYMGVAPSWETNANKWRIRKAGNGKYLFLSDVAMGLVREGYLTKTATWDDGVTVGGNGTTDSADIWTVEESPKLKVAITNGYSDKVIDINGTISSGVSTHQWEDLGKPSQSWDLVAIGETDANGIPLYKIVVNGKNLAITVDTSTNNVSIWEYASTLTNAKWRVYRTEDGFYKFQSAFNNKYLELSSCNLNDGNKLIVGNNSSCLNKTDQKWRISSRSSEGNDQSVTILSSPTEAIKSAFTDIYSDYIQHLEESGTRYWNGVSLVRKSGNPLTTDLFTNEAMYRKSLPHLEDINLGLKFKSVMVESVVIDDSFEYLTPVCISANNQLINNTSINQTLSTPSCSLVSTSSSTTTTTQGWEASASSSYSLSIKGSYFLNFQKKKGQNQVEFIGSQVLPDDTPLRAANTRADDNPTNTVNFTIGGKYSSTSSVSQAWTEAVTLTMPSQNIIVPPYCKAVVDTVLVKTQANGVLTMLNTTIGEPVINATIDDEIYSFYPTYPFYVFKDNDNVRNRNLIFTYDENNQPALGLRVRARFSMDAGAYMKNKIKFDHITPGSCPLASNS